MLCSSPAVWAVDTTPPVIDVLYPHDGMKGVTPLVQLVFAVTDNDCVATNMVTVTVNGTDVSSDLQVDGACDALTIRYRAQPKLVLGQAVHITITAKDNSGNPAHTALDFTITDGFDANLNGMPDDWEAETGLTNGDGDADGDGLDNRYEAQFGSDPLTANAAVPGEDLYEPDDSAETASWIGKTGVIQVHNFHDTGANAPDEDWAAFYAAANEKITILTQNQGPLSDTKTDIVDTDGQTVLDSDSNSGFGPGDSYLIFTAPASAVYYVRVTNEGQGMPGAEAYYALQVIQEIGPDSPASITGHVVDNVTNKDVADASVTMGYSGIPVRKTTVLGEFQLLGLSPGSYTVTVSHPDYKPSTQTFYLITGQNAKPEFKLEPKAVPPTPTDLNGDHTVDAVDVQLVIIDVLGIDISPYNGDVNGDSKHDAVDIQMVINAALGI